MKMAQLRGFPCELFLLGRIRGGIRLVARASHPGHVLRVEITGRVLLLQDPANAIAIEARAALVKRPGFTVREARIRLPTPHETEQLAAGHVARLDLTNTVCVRCLPTPKA